jgi:hypothetical protein
MLENLWESNFWSSGHTLECPSSEDKGTLPKVQILHRVR